MVKRIEDLPQTPESVASVKKIFQVPESVRFIVDEVQDDTLVTVKAWADQTDNIGHEGLSKIAGTGLVVRFHLIGDEIELAHFGPYSSMSSEMYLQYKKAMIPVSDLARLGITIPWQTQEGEDIPDPKFMQFCYDFLLGQAPFVAVGKPDKYGPAVYQLISPNMSSPAYPLGSATGVGG